MEFKTYHNHIKESILDPIHKDLSSDVWDENKKMKPEVRNQIFDILHTWINNIKLNQEPESLYMVGSLTGYQYNDSSDIDIEVVLDINEEKLKRLKKIIPNGNLLKNTNHPINYFIRTPDMETENFRSIYNIIEDEWILKPTIPKQSKSYYKLALNQAISWARKIALDLDEIERNEIELQTYKEFLEKEELQDEKEEIQKYIEFKELALKAGYDNLKINVSTLKNFRNEAFQRGGNEPFDGQTINSDEEHPDYSLNNLIWKILEKFNYIEKIYDKETELLEKYPELIQDE